MRKVHVCIISISLCLLGILGGYLYGHSTGVTEGKNKVYSRLKESEQSLNSNRYAAFSDGCVQAETKYGASYGDLKVRFACLEDARNSLSWLNIEQLYQ